MCGVFDSEYIVCEVLDSEYIVRRSLNTSILLGGLGLQVHVCPEVFDSCVQCQEVFEYK